MSRNLFALFVVFTLAAGLPLHAAPSSDADLLVRLVRERLSADLEAGSMEVAEELVAGLGAGLVERPALFEELRDVAEEGLRIHRARDPRGLELTRLLSEARPGAPWQARTDEPVFTFPRDEGAHSKLSEWWYWNGSLVAADGRRFGFQLCFFHVHLGVYFMHCAVTDEQGERFVYSRNFFRPSRVFESKTRLGLAYGTTTAKEVEGGGQELRFAVGDFQVKMVATPTRDPMIFENTGVIDMPEGTTSMYYSRTALAASGTVTMNGEPLEVQGQAWLDHQWGNFICLLRPWDWFCVQMPDGTAYNMFSFRAGFGQPIRSHVNVLSPTGALDHGSSMVIHRKRWWKSPHTRKYYVTAWRLELPERGESFEVEATMEDQEMPRVGWWDLPPTYWEGGIRVTRTHSSGRVDHGRGYSEHFPYRRPLD